MNRAQAIDEELKILRSIAIYVEMGDFHLCDIGLALLIEKWRSLEPTSGD
jgi:hypothetical protein